jgi:hypothetical protein
MMDHGAGHVKRVASPCVTSEPLAYFGFFLPLPHGPEIAADRRLLEHHHDGQEPYLWRCHCADHP